MSQEGSRKAQELEELAQKLEDMIYWLRHILATQKYEDMIRRIYETMFYLPKDYPEVDIVVHNVLRLLDRLHWEIYPEITRLETELDDVAWRLRQRAKAV